MEDQTIDDSKKSTDFYSSSFLNKMDKKDNNIKTHKEETIENNMNLDNLEYQFLHFFCKKCQTVPKIIFNSYENATYFCSCHGFQDKKIGEILNLYIIDESNFKPLDFLACKEHQKVYVYFCKDCKKNICRECIRNKMNHKTHLKEIFDEHFCEIDEIAKNVLEIFKNNNDVNLENIKRLMNVIINDYNYFPNYSHFFIIRQCYFFLSHISKEIKNIKELKDINNNLENIQRIICIKQDIKDISQIKFGELTNLTELNLSQNFIKNIEPLSKYKLPKLKILDLAVNLIDDSNKEYFFKFDFPELTVFNIFGNRLTDYEILKFNNNKKFPKLNKVLFGDNIFKFPDKQINKKELEFDFFSVIEIGFKRNVFNDSSIMFLPCFILKNIEIIYLQDNSSPYHLFTYSLFVIFQIEFI